MKTLIIGLSILGTLSAFANNDCKITVHYSHGVDINKRIEKRVTKRLKKKGYSNIIFSFYDLHEGDPKLHDKRFDLVYTGIDGLLTWHSFGDIYLEGRKVGYTNGSGNSRRVLNTLVKNMKNCNEYL